MVFAAFKSSFSLGKCLAFRLQKPYIKLFSFLPACKPEYRVVVERVVMPTYYSHEMFFAQPNARSFLAVTFGVKRNFLYLYQNVHWKRGFFSFFSLLPKY